MAPVEPPPAGSVMTYEQLRQAKMQATQRAFAELQSLSADLTQETRRQAGENQQQKQPRRTWTRRKLFDKTPPAAQYHELERRAKQHSTERLCPVFPLLCPSGPLYPLSFPPLSPPLPFSPATRYLDLNERTPERSTAHNPHLPPSALLPNLPPPHLSPPPSTQTPNPPFSQQASELPCYAIPRAGRQNARVQHRTALPCLPPSAYLVTVPPPSPRAPLTRLQNSPATQCIELDKRTPERRTEPLCLSFPVLSTLLQNSPVTQYIELDDKTPERSTTRRTRAWQLRPMGSAGSAEAGTVVQCGKEVYTEEDLRKLRGHVKPYDISVERFKNRVYDPVNGKTCHQCRQKTLGLRTECAACKDRSVCGQFCGDCLFVRYGENIEEALADPTWECPVCRDICNCSICRNRKGWGPTGPLFHKVWGAGYQSVAHYLMLNRMVKDGESTGARADGGVEGGSGSEEGGSGSEEGGEAEGGSDGAGESGEGDEEGGCEEEGGQEGSEVTLIEECKDGNEKARKRKREVQRSAVETRGRKQGLARKKECVIRKGEEEDEEEEEEEEEEKEKEEDNEDVVEIQVCRTVVQVKEEREEGEVEGVSEIEWTKMTAVEEEEEEGVEVDEGEVERKEEEGLRRKGQVKVKTENTPTTCGKKTFGGSSIWGIKGGSLVEIATGAGAGSEVKREESEVKREEREVKRESGIMTRRAAARMEAEAAKLKAAHGRVLRSRTIHAPQAGGAAAAGGRAGVGKGVVAAVGDSKKGTKSGLKLVMRSAVKGMGKRGGREEVEEDKAQLRHLQKEEDSDSDDDVVEVVVARTV
ncbi:unnamed protein product [Closterium sp. Naga37s-1]|nr:unnamed protein product [Closterium sp. Naga37s-1]